MDADNDAVYRGRHCLWFQRRVLRLSSAANRNNDTGALRFEIFARLHGSGLSKRGSESDLQSRRDVFVRIRNASVTTHPGLSFAPGHRSKGWRVITLLLGLVTAFHRCQPQVLVQAPVPAGVSSQAASAPETTELVATNGVSAIITLQDAIERARRYYAQYRAAVTAAELAKQDRVQARASLLPSISYTQQYLGTEGNGVISTGRFVTNDGVHVYRAWGVLHEDMPAGFFTLAPYRRAEAGAVLAQAQAEIARRGLTVTVTNLYYSAIVAQREYASAKQNLDQATQFLTTTKQLEQGGEVPRADVLKAQLQFDQVKIAYQEAQLAVEHAHLALAVLLSPVLDENFTAVDDLGSPPVLPSMDEINTMAARANPYVRSALASLQQANVDVSVARAGFFPTFTLDADYGIEANAFALHSTVAAFPEKGVLPNLGYFVTAGMNIPVWNWGSTESKLRQAKYKRQQAQVELSQAQREALSNLSADYSEAQVARAEIETLRQDVDLASNSLRLTMLQYKAGDAIELEVLSAQTALSTAKNALDVGEARYRVALATLQTLTGEF
jgi:outer membrane protein TolC